MRCVLEINGKKYPSTEFTERQVSAFIAAVCGSTGMNVLEMLEGNLSADSKVFRQYGSIEAAENDLSYLLKKLFPTFDRQLESIDTAELIAIVMPMAQAINPNPSTTAIELSENKLKNMVETVEDLEYPPKSKTLTEKEKAAVRHAASTTGQSIDRVNHWYLWWKTVYDPADDFTPTESIEVLHEVAPASLDRTNSDRYYLLITAYLESDEGAIAA